MAAYRNIPICKQKGVVSCQQDIHSMLDYWLRTCSNGEYLLTFKRVTKPRSVNQNRLMWLWFSCIAESWSEACCYAVTPQDVHDAYCLMFLPKDTPRGRIGGSTSALSTEQMTEFLSKVQADAQTEYGITLPNPDDQFFEAWAEQYKH